MNRAKRADWERSPAWRLSQTLLFSGLWTWAETSTPLGSRTCQLSDWNSHTGSAGSQAFWLGLELQLSWARSLRTAHLGTSQPPSSHDPVPHKESLCLYLYTHTKSYWLCSSGESRLIQGGFNIFILQINKVNGYTAITLHWVAELGFISSLHDSKSCVLCMITTPTREETLKRPFRFISNTIVLTLQNSYLDTELQALRVHQDTSNHSITEARFTQTG